MITTPSMAVFITFIIAFYNLSIASNTSTGSAFSVPSKYVSRIEFFFNVLQTVVKAICYNRIRLLFEFVEIIDDE